MLARLVTGFCQSQGFLGGSNTRLGREREVA